MRVRVRGLDGKVTGPLGIGLPLGPALERIHNTPWTPTTLTPTSMLAAAPACLDLLLDREQRGLRRQHGRQQ